MIVGLPREPTMTISILIIIKYERANEKNIRNTKNRDELSENSRDIEKIEKNA